MSFNYLQTVRFAHVDAAGIVFYPRYFEMLNTTVEEYFKQEIGVGFAPMHLERRLGVPTVDLEVKFLQPSRLGDELDFQLTVNRVGRSSVDITVIATCVGARRIEVRATLVCMDLVLGKSTGWPDDMIPRIHQGTAATADT